MFCFYHRAHREHRVEIQKVGEKGLITIFNIFFSVNSAGSVVKFFKKITALYQEQQQPF